VFDVNRPHTLAALTRWWDEFRAKAPVPDADAARFCVVLVGNKVDLARADGGADGAVGELEALRFLDGLVPEPVSGPPSPVSDHSSVLSHDEPLTDREALAPAHPLSIARPRHPKPKSLSRSHSRSAGSMLRGGGGTVTTTRTTITIYHTPSSSLSLSSSPTSPSHLDRFESARSSRYSSHSRSRSSRSSLSLELSPPRAPRRVSSLSMSTTSDAPTITPSIYLHNHAAPHARRRSRSPDALPPQPERRPKLFFASAKTGEGVPDIFAYVAQRVLLCAAYDAALDARRAASADDMTIHLDGAHDYSRARGGWQAPGAGTCCSS
jgi:Ras-related protein Rab-7A